MAPAKKLLVVGNGGREHALVWRLGSSMAACDVIFTTHPAVAATTAPCTLEFCPAKSVDQLVAFAMAQGVTLVVVGPEAPLAEGITGASIWAPPPQHQLRRGISRGAPRQCAPPLRAPPVRAPLLRVALQCTQSLRAPPLHAARPAAPLPRRSASVRQRSEPRRGVV